MASIDNKTTTETPTVEPLSEETTKKILRQVEFYFGNSNLRTDKFLRGKTEENAEGNVEIALIASFKRMRQLTENADAVADVLRKSDRLVVSEDGKFVRRSSPLPETDDSKERTVYAKGFPKDTTLESLETFFSEFGRVECVRMRRTGKGFKGSVTCEFEKLEEAKAFLDSSPSFNGTPLAEVSALEAFEAEKKAAAPAAALPEKVDPESVTFESGLILKVVGVGAASSREDLTAAVESFGTVQYVDFSRGETEGYLRFAEAGVAAKAAAGLVEAKTEVDGCVPTWSVLEGEDEKAYHVKVEQRKLDSKKRRSQHGGGRGRGRFNNKRQRRN